MAVAVDIDWLNRTRGRRLAHVVDTGDKGRGVRSFRPDPDLTITIRGLSGRVTGLFGDGIIGAQALQYRIPLVTNDGELAEIVRRLGGTVVVAETFRALHGWTHPGGNASATSPERQLHRLCCDGWTVKANRSTRRQIRGAIVRLPGGSYRMDTAPIVKTFDALLTTGAAVAVIVCAFFLMLSGYQYMTAGGSVRSLESAKSSLSHALISPHRNAL